MQQIVDWLEKLGMSEYAQRFAVNHTRYGERIIGTKRFLFAVLDVCWRRIVTRSYLKIPG